MKNSLILDRVTWLCKGKELLLFPSLYSQFLHFFKLPTFHRFAAFPFPIYPPLLLPSPVPSIVLYIPLSLSTFLLHFQPSPFKLYFSPFHFIFLSFFILLPLPFFPSLRLIFGLWFLRIYIHPWHFNLNSLITILQGRKLLLLRKYVRSKHINLIYSYFCMFQS